MLLQCRSERRPRLRSGERHKFRAPWPWGAKIRAPDGPATRPEGRWGAVASGLADAISPPHRMAPQSQELQKEPFNDV